MKIFDKFTLSDKRNELVIRYYDEAMSTGKMHTVYALSDIRSGKLRWRMLRLISLILPNSAEYRSRMFFFSTRRRTKKSNSED